MDRQRGQKVLDGLRAAADAKGAVVELLAVRSARVLYPGEKHRDLLWQHHW